MARAEDGFSLALDSGGYDRDIVGIGALNLDYLADVDAAGGTSVGDLLSERISHLLEESGTPLEWGTERSVDARTIYAAIEAVSSAQPDTALGGSAFNAVYAIAHTRVGLRLGYVGVAGRVPVIGLSALQQFDALGIDRRFVLRDDEHLCGVCFSYSEMGDRTLLTHAGANSRFAEHIRRSFADIVDYLARTRMIHVTSFLDGESATELLAVLTAVKARNPHTGICFDPGHVWSTNLSNDIEGILRISDYLLVNQREFRELSETHGADYSDEDAAALLLQRMNSEEAVVVVKRPTGVWAHHRDGAKVSSAFYPQVPLGTEEIEDATGAGDVFAAGLLTILTCEKLQVELGSLLGMRLARHKLRYVGSAGHTQFAQLTRTFIRSLDAQRTQGGQSSSVFIAHGAHPEWLAVQRFVEERFRVPVYSFESGSWGGKQVTEALAEYLERCKYAICVLTAEDFTGDGGRRARQNVIHEVGLFQGRHGFQRVIVLAEEGCDFVPPAAVARTIYFPHNGIYQAFYKLDAMMRAEGLSTADRGDDD